MPKVTAQVLDTKIVDGRLLAKLQFNERLPKIGELVNVKWGATRSLSQNALYWQFLTWCIDNGLKDQGHFSPDALHLDLKQHFLAAKIMSKGEFKAIEESTTTDFNKVEFGEYMDKVSEFMREFLGLNVQPFWDNYEAIKI